MHTHHQQLRVLTIRHRLTTSVACLATALLLGACADATGPSSENAGAQQLVMDVSVVNASSIGELVELTARALGENGATLTGARLLWSSSDSSVLASEGGGRFRTRRNGTAVAMVQVAGNTRVAARSAQVVVQQQATTVEITTDSVSLWALDQSFAVQTRMTDALGNVLTVPPLLSWSSPDATVATIDASGVVTARGDGMVLLALQAGNVTRTVQARVSSSVRIAGCVSSSDVATTSCSEVLFPVRVAR